MDNAKKSCVGAAGIEPVATTITSPDGRTVTLITRESKECYRVEDKTDGTHLGYVYFEEDSKGADFAFEVEDADGDIRLRGEYGHYDHFEFTVQHAAIVWMLIH